MNDQHPLAGKIFYHRCEDDPRYFKTIRLHLNPFVNGLVPQISNPVMGEPPPNLESINPSLLQKLLRVQMSSYYKA